MWVQYIFVIFPSQHYEAGLRVFNAFSVIKNRETNILVPGIPIAKGVSRKISQRSIYRIKHNLFDALDCVYQHYQELSLPAFTCVQCKFRNSAI